MEDTAPGFDPSRRLCPDGACVGVIGADGRCGVGRRAAGAAVSDDDDAGAAAAGGEASVAVATAAAVSPIRPDGGASSGFDPRRRLCPDGACIGVIGPNGACGACGRKAD